MENQHEKYLETTLGDLLDKNIDKLLSDESFRNSRIDQHIKQVHYGFVYSLPPLYIFSSGLQEVC